MRFFNKLAILIVLSSLVSAAGCKKGEDEQTAAAASHAKAMLEGKDTDDNSPQDATHPNPDQEKKGDQDIDWNKIDPTKINIDDIQLNPGENLLSDKLAISMDQLKSQLVDALSKDNLTAPNGEPFKGTLVYDTSLSISDGERIRMITLIGEFSVDTKKAHIPIHANMVLERDFGKQIGPVQDNPEEVKAFYKGAVDAFLKQIRTSVEAVVAPPESLNATLLDPTTLPETQHTILDRIGLEQIKGAQDGVRHVLTTAVDPQLLIAAAQTAYETGDKDAVPLMANAAQKMQEKKQKELIPMMMIITRTGGPEARKFLNWVAVTDKGKPAQVAQNLIKVGDVKGFFGPNANPDNAINENNAQGAPAAPNAAPPSAPKTNPAHDHHDHDHHAHQH